MSKLVLYEQVAKPSAPAAGAVHLYAKTDNQLYWQGDDDVEHVISSPAGSVVVASGKTVTFSNTVTFTANDGATLAIGAGGTLGSAAYTASTAYATAAQGAKADTAAQATNHLGFFAATTSAQLAGVISDETGTGLLVFATNPVLVTPTLGVAAATSLVTSGDVTVGGNLSVTGNFTVNGNTTIFNSTVITVDDPIFTLGGDTAPGADDNKDRGIEFRWHDGSTAKIGFFGYDDSASVFTFIPDAVNTSEVFSGTAGNVAFGSGTFASTLAVTGNVTLTADIAVNGGDITSTSLIANLFNTTSTTVNIGSFATTFAVGAATGTFTVNNTTLAAKAGTFSTTLGVTGNTTLTGDLAVNGGDITTSATTFNFVTATATTLNVGLATTSIRFGGTPTLIGFGGPVPSTSKFRFTGTTTSTGAGSSFSGISLESDFTAAASDVGYLAHVSNMNNVTTQGTAATIALVATYRIAEPGITVGAGDTITLASTVHIVSAPTEGVMNAALSIAAGNLITAGNVHIGSITVAPAGNLDVSAATGGVLTLRRIDTTLGANDLVGKVQFYAADTQTTTNFIVAEIEAQTTNSIATDINPGRLIIRATSTAVGALPTDVLRFTQAVSAVNYAQFTGAATGAGPVLSAQGTDGNIDLTFTPKGTGNIKVSTGTLSLISTGGAATSGTATLVAGTITVNTTAVTANSKVIITRKTAGGTVGMAITYTVVAGTSFTINSDNPLDTSTFTWVILESF